MVLLSVLVVLLAGAVAALAVGRIGTGLSVSMPEPVHTTGHDVLGPDVTRAELASVRFDRAARGYRMDQVDAVLDRLAEELELRDRRIADLTAERRATSEIVPGAGDTATDAWPAEAAPDGEPRGTAS